MRDRIRSATLGCGRGLRGLARRLAVQAVVSGTVLVGLQAIGGGAGLYALIFGGPVAGIAPVERAPAERAPAEREAPKAGAIAAASGAVATFREAAKASRLPIEPWVRQDFGNEAGMRVEEAGAVAATVLGRPALSPTTPRGREAPRLVATLPKPAIATALEAGTMPAGHAPRASTVADASSGSDALRVPDGVVLFTDCVTTCESGDPLATPRDAWPAELVQAADTYGATVASPDFEKVAPASGSIGSRLPGAGLVGEGIDGVAGFGAHIGHGVGHAVGWIANGASAAVATLVDW